MPDRRIPDLATVRSAVAMAVRAPSAHNAQPWQWRIGYSTLHLFMDPEPRPPRTEADRRDLVLGCGAALHHLRVGFGALGWATDVDRLPDDGAPGHLAVVKPVRTDPAEPDIVLAAAIPHRRSDRRAYSGWPVPSEYIAALADEAAREGARLRVVSRRCRNQAASAVAEAAWRRVDATGEPLPGVRRPSTAAEPATGTVLTRPLTAARPVAPPTAPESRGTEVLVVSTPADDVLSRLRAGEATSAVLLRATALGLASCALTEPLTTSGVREILDDVTGGDVPQVLVRVGWAAANAEPLPPTPRQGLAYVLEPLQAPPKYHHRLVTG